jgi:hypothetical protein
VVYLALIIPAALLGLLLLMERVERPLREDDVRHRIDEWLDSAGPDQLEVYISEGLSRPLKRYWRRQPPSRAVGALQRT